MYAPSIVANGPGTLSRVLRNIDLSQYKKISFIDSYDDGRTFDVDSDALCDFVERNKDVRVAFSPHSGWSPDTVQIDIDYIS